MIKKQKHLQGPLFSQDVPEKLFLNESRDYD